MRKIFPILLLLLLCGSARAELYYTNDAAFYFGDSYTKDGHWRLYVTNVPNCKFKSQLVYALSGNTLGMVVSNQWPLAKAMLSATNFPGRKIAFLLIGANKNNPPSFVNPPEYTSTNWVAAWSNLVVEMRSSNILVYAFTVAELPGDYTYSYAYNWPLWKSYINSYLMESTLPWKLQQNHTLLTTNDLWDGIHPTEAGYAIIGTNVVQNLSQKHIGQNARLTEPTQAEWAGVANFRPYQGQVCDLNPPRFSWTYKPDMTSWDTGESDYRREFTFQIATNSGFDSPMVNVRTRSAFYNFIAPFTNADGSTYTNTLYWRVGYSHITNLAAIYAYSDTRTFTILSNAPVMDRSGIPLALTNAGHPRLYFTSATKSNLLWNMTRNTNAWVSNSFRVMRGSVTNLMTNSVWTNWAYISWTSQAKELMQVAFMRQMYGDAFTNYLADNLNSWANEYRARELYNVDEGGGSGIEGLNAHAPFYYGLAVDWGYDLLTELQRSNIVNALDGRCTNLNYIGFTGDTNSGTLHKYFTTTRQSLEYVGESHTQGYFMRYISVLLAMSGDSTNYMNASLHYLNFMIGRTVTYGSEDGFNQGHSYNPLHLAYGYLLDSHILAAMTFPDAHLERNPFWSRIGEWFARFTPAGFRTMGDHWGESDFAPTVHFQFRDFGQKLAVMTGNGRITKRWTDDARGGWNYMNSYTFPLPFLIPMSQWTLPPETNTTERAVVYPQEGWVIGTGKTANTEEAFTNGVGFITRASPSGQISNHGAFADLGYELWAYGAPITEAGNGSGMGGTKEQNHNVILINGLGFGGSYFPVTTNKILGRVAAFTNGIDHTYAALDGTKLYRGHPYITNATRHLLFLRNRYFVMFDQIGASSNITASALHHIHNVEPTVSADWFSYTYSATNFLNRTVTVHVAQIATNGIAVIPVTGALVRSNIITGATVAGTSTRAATIWTQNQTTASNVNLLTVIYPQKWDESAPTITRIDDYTVAVTNGGQGDVITFDTNRADIATLIVDVGATNAPPEAPVELPLADSPVFDPTSGTFSNNVTITLTAPAVTSPSFFWTTNAWTSSNAGPLIELTNSALVSAFTRASGYRDSAPATSNYTITNAEPPVVPPPSTNSPYVNSVMSGGISFR